METVLFAGGGGHETEFGTNGLCFIVEFVVFKCPFRPIQANCRIYVVFLMRKCFMLRNSGDKLHCHFEYCI